MKTVMIPLCLTIIFLSGLVSVGATAPLSFRMNSSQPTQALAEMPELVALAYRSENPDWQQVAKLARKILTTYGDFMYYFPADPDVSPPLDILERINSQGGREGMRLALAWTPDEQLQGPGGYVVGTSVSGTLLRALIELKDWAGVEDLTLGILACYDADTEAWIEYPEGAYLGLEVARRKLAEAGDKETAPVALSGAKPGYVATSEGSAELRRVAEWIGAPLKWDAATKTASLALGGELWQFVPGSARVVSSTGGVFLLPKPVSLQAGRLRVPLEALKIAGTVKWDSTTRIAWFTPKQG